MKENTSLPQEHRWNRDYFSADRAGSGRADRTSICAEGGKTNAQGTAAHDTEDARETLDDWKDEAKEVAEDVWNAVRKSQTNCATAWGRWLLP